MERILVIEDDEMIAKMLRSVLEKAGYAVSEARNGKEGLLAQQREAADLVITDLIMPEKEGLETILDLKKKYPLVKILAVSGGGRMAPEAQLNVAKKFGHLFLKHGISANGVYRGKHQAIAQVLYFWPH